MIQGNNRLQMPNSFNDFKKRLKNNRFLNKNDTIREKITEIVKGYPTFTEKALGPPDIQIKREKLLLSVFELKGINNDITLKDCAKIVKIFDDEYNSTKDHKNKAAFVQNFALKIKDVKIRNIILANFKLIRSFYSK